MKKHIILNWLMAGLLVLGTVSAAVPVQMPQAATQTQDQTREVPYHINKAGTDTASVADKFFTGMATVTTTAAGQTVTLHLGKLASYVKAFKIGTQAAVVTNATQNTADLTFKVDDSFKQATVTASMNVMNMTQQADIVFDAPLYQEPAAFDADHLVAGTYELPYVLNKYGQDKPSLANGFFTGMATVVVAPDLSETVTLHLSKYASMIKSFAIGTQDATITNATQNTADLTFKVDQQFATKVVTASMNVMNMNQKADLTFTQPLAPKATPAVTQPTAGDPATTEPTDSSTTTEPTDETSPTATEPTQPATDPATEPSTPPTTGTEPTTDLPSVTTPAAPFDPTHLVAGTYAVPYTLNKAGTTTPSLANGFFTGVATVVVAPDLTETVTLHLSKYASMVKSFAIGTQAAAITNATTNTADLTFKVDPQFAGKVVTASMNVLNMNQQADLAFATPLTVAPATPATADDDPATEPTTDEPTTTTPTTTSFDPAHPVAGTYQVTYTVNKAGTTTPSLANSFFTGVATVVIAPDLSATVTLHVSKFASVIKQFAIGTQAARFANVTSNTADLTFTVDPAFAGKTVTATMNVMNMAQQADLVFAQALAPQTTVTKPTESTKPVTTQPTKPTPTAKPTPAKAGASRVPVAIYQASAGKLTHERSAAGNFIASTATLKTLKNGQTRVTLHTTGADYIDQMTLLGRTASVTNRHGQEADLTFTLPSASLKAALPAVFHLTVPGGIQMTEAAYVLIDLPVSAAKVATPTPLVATAAASRTTGTIRAAGSGHAIDPTKTTQTIGYTVWDQGQTALSNANSYFTHQAQVVKTGSGYRVTLTVQAPAGVVSFTPRTVNGAAVSGLTHRTAGGQDVWTYSFTVASATGLDHAIPATIELSVPMAGIANATFTVWLQFARTAGAGGVTAATKLGTKAKALPTKTIHLTPAAQAATVAPIATPASAPLPQLEPMHLQAEVAGFAVAGLAIMSFAWFRRRQLERKAA